jgi:hypothetical protein
MEVIKFWSRVMWFWECNWVVSAFRKVTVKHLHGRRGGFLCSILDSFRKFQQHVRDHNTGLFLNYFSAEILIVLFPVALPLYTRVSNRVQSFCTREKKKLKINIYC